MKKVAAFLPAALISLSLLLLAAACGGGGEANPFGVESEVVTEAKRPVAMAFAPDGRLFFAEQHTGNIYVVAADGQLLEDPFVQVDVNAYSGWGMTGIAVDPDFETNHYVYVFFTEAAKPQAPATGRPVITRFTDTNNRGMDPKVIVGDLPEAGPERHFYANGSIHFGPDGLLYFSVGDYDLDQTLGFPQDLSRAQGKMFRVNKEDGSAPRDNPFVNESDADPRIFAYGFHVSFDFAFHPEGGQIYGTDNTVSCEEVNIVEAGVNYGWPDVGEFPWPDCFAGGQVPAIHFLAKEGSEPGKFLSAVSAAGMEFASGDVYPLIGDGLLVCESKTKLMRRLTLTGPDFEQVTNDDVIVEDCELDIAVSPDGIIYYSNGEEIRRLVLVEGQQPE